MYFYLRCISFSASIVLFFKFQHFKIKFIYNYITELNGCTSPLYFYQLYYSLQKFLDDHNVDKTKLPQKLTHEICDNPFTMNTKLKKNLRHHEQCIFKACLTLCIPSVLGNSPCTNFRFQDAFEKQKSVSDIKFFVKGTIDEFILL